MPKIIENVKTRLLAEARRQIAENGYAGTTIRSVAAKCGIAVGTVYNYFPSKDVLIASFMAQDWAECINGIRALPTSDAKALLGGIYSGIIGFSRSHSALFSDPEAEKVFFSVVSKRHAQLREQIARVILPVCSGENAAFKATFIAEAVLAWSGEGKGFEEVFPLLEPILTK